jgi:hypothetical protein
MNQFAMNWRGILPRLTFSALIALSSASAQAQVSGGIPMPTPAPQPTAQLVYSKNFASASTLSNMSGSFYDEPVTAQAVLPDGRVSTYSTYFKRLDVVNFTTDSTGRLTSGDFANSLTFTVPPNEDVVAAGGSLTLNDLRWTLESNGTAAVWAATSGTGIEPSYLKAWTSASVSRQGGTAVLANLKATPEFFLTMIDALGFDPEGVGYSSLTTSTSNLGTLTMSAVPEAATWAQLSLGLIGLGALVRRKTMHTKG